MKNAFAKILVDRYHIHVLIDLKSISLVKRVEFTNTHGPGFKYCKQKGSLLHGEYNYYQK
jgi:hypothetical protein